jgi:BASS family bile acid:Na+ symporter
VLKRATDLFPLWAVLAAAAAWAAPAPFATLEGAIVPLLGLVMLGMGATLAPRDFARVGSRPGLLVLGMALQFGGMPAIGWAVARALALPPELFAGVVLVGSCPGGTASNVICYLARADVALSITLTAFSTVLAVVATPLLTDLWLGASVAVDVPGMIASIFRIVLVPVALGVALNAWLGPRLAPARRLFPLLSVAAIVLIIAIVVALSRARLAELSALVFAAVVLHNGLGLLLGWAVPALLRLPEAERRTLSIEVGMQNSGLGVALAVAHFGPLAALPGALFSVWHNLSGSLLAAFWSRRSAPASR